MTESLHSLGAAALVRLLARRRHGAAEVADALLARSAALDPALQAWSALDAGAVRRRARAGQPAAVAGPLQGLPIGVKDNIDTAGIVTSYGSPIYAGHVPAIDAACVAVARAAGAWVLGKTRCTEFANMTPCATRNPWHAAHTPGGSSSGSAAAVAAGLVPVALGTQTAGSVIRPAAFCGIVGYKPSPRRLPRAGVKANADTLDELGILARCVEDAALLADVLDGSARGAAPADAAPRFGTTLTSRAGALSPAMAAMLGGAAQRLSAAGAPVRDVAWPAGFDALFDAQRTVQLFETARALAPEHQLRRAQLSTGLRALLDEGRRIPAQHYAAALRSADAAQRALPALFEGADVLLVPAAPGAAPRSRRSTGDPLFSRPWQLLGCPCITLPGGLDADGLPLGLQLVARPGEDGLLFAAAAWAERVLQSQDIARARCG